jgi:hypothetical protein
VLDYRNDDGMVDNNPYGFLEHISNLEDKEDESSDLALLGASVTYQLKEK